MSFPKINALLICEGARPEPLGKFNLLGFYGLAPVTIAIEDFSKPLTFCFVFSGGAGAGKFRTSIRVIAPDGQGFAGLEGADGELLPGRSNSLFLYGFKSILPGPGNYQVALIVNDAEIYRGNAFVLTQAASPKSA